MSAPPSTRSSNPPPAASSDSRPNTHLEHPGSHGGVNELFRHFSHRASELVGSSWAFFVALAIIVVWGLTGPIFHFSDTWQLIINTGTTIVTFLMVFLIQNTQNRDAKAFHLKLDELIRAQSGARNRLIDLEDCSDEELRTLQKAFERLREDTEEVFEEVEEIEGTFDEEGEWKREQKGRNGAKRRV